MKDSLIHAVVTVHNSMKALSKIFAVTSVNVESDFQHLHIPKTKRKEIHRL